MGQKDKGKKDANAEGNAQQRSDSSESRQTVYQLLQRGIFGRMMTRMTKGDAPPPANESQNPEASDASVAELGFSGTEEENVKDSHDGLVEADFQTQRAKIIAERYEKWQRHRNTRTDSPGGKGGKSRGTTGVNHTGDDLAHDSAPVNSLADAKRRWQQSSLFLSRTLSRNNPLQGRLVFTFGCTIAIIVAFWVELMFNKLTFNGRCLGHVAYDDLDFVKRPYALGLGYVACEYNLRTSAARRVFFGPGATDVGYPPDIVENGKALQESSKGATPNYRIYTQLGGSDINFVRKYGEYFRPFWSIFLHSGWTHIVFNLLCQFQVLWILEPDWGFFRTALLYFISGYGSLLFASVYSPCYVVIGASGGLFGCLGALIPYCVEYWGKLTNPFEILVFTIITVLLASMGGIGSSHLAHMSGFVFGMLWGFATIADNTAFKGEFKYKLCLTRPLAWCLSKKKKERYRTALDKKVKARTPVPRGKTALQSAKNVATRAATKNHNAAQPKRKRFHWIRAKRTRGVRLVNLTCLGVLVWWFVYLLMAAHYEPLYKTINSSTSYFFANECKCCTIKKTGDTVQTKHIGQLEDAYWCFSSAAKAKYFCDL